MKRNHIKSIGKAFLLLLIVLPMIVGCTGNFEKYNTHPYRPYKPDLIWLTNLMRIMNYAHENKSQHYDQMIGGEYGGYFTMSNLWNGTNFSTYNPSNDWIGIPFLDVMTDTYGNFFEGERQTKKEGPTYELAKIIRVIIMLKLTDTYGPIPYSKMGSGGFVTSYDDQKDLYPLFISDLDNAIKVLTAYVAATNNEKPLKDFDVVYEGDFTKWVKLANSIKLRIAVRINKVSPQLAKTAANEAVAHTIGVIQSNSDNAYIAIGVQNPYWKAAMSWNDMRSNASITSYMNGYSDPRRKVYFTPASVGNVEYNGIRTGMSTFAGKRDDYLKLSSPNINPGDPMPVMTAAEVAFLMAEGVYNNWDMGGDIRSFYEKGITLSMQQHGVKPAEIEGYIVDNTSVPADYTDPNISVNSASALSDITIKWDDAAGDDQKLERIIVQKWIAIYPLGIEAWSEYRRTGYPKMFKVITNKSSGANKTSTDRMARRVRFAPAEYQQNKENVEAAVQMLGGPDTPSTDLWWAKKN